MKKTVIVTGICAILLVIVYLQFKTKTTEEDPRGNLYAGSKTCVKCHSDLYNSYLHTAHYLASLPATEKTVHGNFTKGSNIFNISATQKVVMEKHDSGLYQTCYLNEKIKASYRFDIVFGGVKGESYLYWQDNELYQLPLSYFAQQHKWSTSPGYKFNFEDLNLRSIGKQCLECHASYINNLAEESQELSKREQFDKNTLVYSIDCERCHGPGKQHADFHTHNSDVTPRFIKSYSSLSRSQKIDMCAICHSGYPSGRLRSTFEFVPGDTFAKFKIPELYRSVDTDYLDVHGNQLQLLQSSKCFLNSNMDCATCHDTHMNSRGNINLYTQKCLNCHNTPNHTYCKMTNKLSNDMLAANCIGCHMPALPSKAITVQISDKTPSVNFLVHTHHIAIYPQEIKKILAYINN